MTSSGGGAGIVQSGGNAGSATFGNLSSYLKQMAAISEAQANGSFFAGGS